MGAGCGGKYHVDGVYIIHSVHGERTTKRRVLAKLLACAGMGRAAKRQSFFRARVARCAGLGAGCGGKYHVDGVYIILSVHGGRTTKRRVDAVYLILLRLPGRGPRRQAPCRRRLQNPQRPQGVASLTFSCGHAAKRGVAKAPSAQASRRTERVSRCACAGVTCAHASPLRLKQGNQQREKRDRQRSLCSACAPASWGKSPVTRMQKLSTAPRLLVLGVHPPPAGAGPHITRMQKLSAAQKAARRVPPPIRGRPRYYPYAKVISSAQSDLRSQMVQALG